MLIDGPIEARDTRGRARVPESGTPSMLIDGPIEAISLQHLRILVRARLRRCSSTAPLKRSKSF